MFTVTPDFYNQIAAAVVLAMKSEIKASSAMNVQKDAEILFTVKDVVGKLQICNKTVIAKIKA